MIISACRLGIDDAELDSGSDDDDDDDDDEEEEEEEFAEQGVVSTGESSDSVDDSWDRPGPSGLQNTGCSSEETTLQDDGYKVASSCSNSEHAPREDPLVLSPEMDNRENESVDQKCDSKEDSLPVKVEGEMDKTPETVNGSVGEEKTGNDEPASVGDSSGENSKEVLEEGERSASSEQQQYPVTTEVSTQEVS